MSPKSTGRGSDQFNLRLSTGMRDRLKGLAEENGRSLNSEIVSRLEASLAGAAGGAGGIDQIFAHAIQGLLSRPEPPAPKIVMRLENAHAAFRQAESQQLRDFLDLIQSIDKGEDLFGSSYEEQTERAREYELNELRAQAHRLGFRLEPSK